MTDTDLDALLQLLDAWLRDEPAAAPCVGCLGFLATFAVLRLGARLIFGPKPPAEATRTPPTGGSSSSAAVSRVLDQIRAQAVPEPPPPPEPKPGTLVRGLLMALECPWDWKMEEDRGFKYLVRHDHGIRIGLHDGVLFAILFDKVLPGLERCRAEKRSFDFPAHEWLALKAAAAGALASIESEQRRVREREEDLIVRAALGRDLGRYSADELIAELKSREAPQCP